MCLSIVGKIYKPPSQKWTTAWKFFDVSSSGHLMFPFNSLRGDWIVPVGRWLKSTTGQNRADDESAYPNGFHVLTTRRDARAFAGRVNCHEVVKVKIRSVVASGKQDGLKILIAREMLVPSPKKKV